MEKHGKEYENVLTLWPWISWVDAGPGAQKGRIGPRPVYKKGMNFVNKTKDEKSVK